MSKDISKLLAEWPYGAGGNIRRLTGEDGHEKVQIRVCLDTFHGLLQFDCDGRPDGKRPHGKEFYLDHLEEKRQLFVEAGGQSEQFRLTHAQCRKLFDESNMVYHRYVLMLQVADFARVIRDTARNMGQAFDKSKTDNKEVSVLTRDADNKNGNKPADDAGHKETIYSGSAKSGAADSAPAKSTDMSPDAIRKLIEAGSVDVSPEYRRLIERYFGELSEN